MPCEKKYLVSLREQRRRVEDLASKINDNLISIGAVEI